MAGTSRRRSAATAADNRARHCSVPYSDDHARHIPVLTFEEIRTFALALPESEEGTCYGTPAFKVRGKLFARLRDEGDVLAVKVDPAFRDALIRSRPETYFITPHYEHSPYVLVRLGTADSEELSDLLADAWRLAAPKRLAAGMSRPPSE